MTTTPSFPGRSRRFHRLAGTVNVGLLAFLALSSSTPPSTGGHPSLGLAGPGLVHVAAAAAASAEMTRDATTPPGDATYQNHILHHEEEHPHHGGERRLQRGKKNRTPPPTPAPVSGPPPTPAPVEVEPPTPAPVAGPTAPQCFQCTAESPIPAVQCFASGPNSAQCGSALQTVPGTCSKSPFGQCETDADCGGKGSKCQGATTTETVGECAVTDCAPTDPPTPGPTGSPVTEAPSARPSAAPTGELVEFWLASFSCLLY